MTSRLYHYPGTVSQPLPTIQQVKQELFCDDKLSHTIQDFRDKVVNILTKRMRKALFIVGPCSIHDPKSACEFAKKLKELSDYVSDKIMLVMRVYCEKPRTAMGWKGLLYDPNLDQKSDIVRGIRMTRELMLEINRIGVPVGTEFLDPLTCYYYQDLVSWGSIGARTSSSQIHRQLASGLPMPIGFKNTTDGDLMNAVNGMVAAGHSQCHIGLSENGAPCSMTTSGNPHTHLVLRGGESKPNFDRPSVAYALELLATHRLPLRLLIDCSHDNSRRDHDRQKEVFDEVIEQIESGNDDLVGLLLESHLSEGQQEAQKFSCLKYGVSITDACLNWEDTESLVLKAHNRLSAQTEQACTTI